MAAMNPYGRRAMEHLARNAPDRLAAMADPQTHFSELGELIAEQVLDLEQSLAGPTPPAETYPERVGRLNMARLRAEEVVFAELVWPVLEDEDEPLMDATGAYLGGRPDWDPLLAMLEAKGHAGPG
ncbi:MAG: TnpV protein [Acidimicrobiales bacterium]